MSVLELRNVSKVYGQGPTEVRAAIAWFRSSLSTTVSHVPVTDLVVILVGLPLAATVGGWLLAGRQPRTTTRQPLE
jgi:hypothetical protein